MRIGFFGLRDKEKEGCYTKEAEQAIMETTALNIESFIKGSAINLVD